MTPDAMKPPAERIVSDADLARMARRFDGSETPAALFDGIGERAGAASRYLAFLAEKSRVSAGHGFEPVYLPDGLKDFQRHLVEWAIRQGRAALFEDCGLGKSYQELVFGENVARKTGRRVLLLTPLAVAPQMVAEGEKFGIGCGRSTDGKPSGERITVANYERLHHFDPSDFAGVICDESSILKNLDGKRRKEITEFMRRVDYRLLCTATAAPNDFHEVGSSSDALGYLGARDMLTRFFKEDTIKDYLGWGRKGYRFRGHAEHPFWQWVCSWARACRKPSDLGFSDAGFDLPPLVEREHLVEHVPPREGMLFALPASGLFEQRQERRATIEERCEAAAGVANAHAGASVIWCHLNDEGDHLEKMAKGGVQVSGSMSDEEKEEKLVAFAAGKIKTLVTKPKIGCFGLNWQHCHNVVTFPSNSWEERYQAIRRCYRFGQTKSVTVTTVTTPGQQGVTENLRRKAEQCERMFAALVTHMTEAVAIDRGIRFTQTEELPQWLLSTR